MFFVYFGEQFFIICLFCVYFLPGSGLSSHSLDTVFHRAKVFNFNEAQHIISFTDIASKKLTYLKMLSLLPRSSRFFLTLSSRSFIVLPFIFNSLIHFQLNFVLGVKSVSRFIYLHVDVHLHQHHLLKRQSLLHCIAFAPLSKISWLYLCGSVPRLSVLLLWSICLF